MAARFPQSITYWAATPDGYGGFSFAAPAHILGRWQDHIENILSAGGDTIVSKAIVYVDTDVAVNGYLAVGTLSDTDPTILSAAHKIQAMTKTANIRYSDYLRKAVL